MPRLIRVLAIAAVSCTVLSIEASASGPPPDPVSARPRGLPPIRDDSTARTIDVDLEQASYDYPGVRLALPPGMSAADLEERGDGRAITPSQYEEWRLDDGTPLLNARLEPGPNHGLANRFDPFDFWEENEIPPRPLRVRRIHFIVHPDEPTGPMEWHIWEENGGHKPDQRRDIIDPFIVMAGPGENIIDLGLQGSEPIIDPPRMFQVGVANKESHETSPDIMLDDGLPYVGDSGDFHASFKFYDEYCAHHTWGLFSTRLPGEEQKRSPVWLIWLEVEWLPEAETRYFNQVDAGDFTGANRVAWGDYDGDGHEDILASGSHILRNNGDGTFSAVTEAAGITDTGNGAAWGDYDNDGDLDFYQYTPNCVPCGHEDNYDDLWRNNGDGTFLNVRNVYYWGDPSAPVPRDPLPTEAATWGDFNGDGYLDLYAANHVDWASGACFDDYLWLNNGPPYYDFRDASVESGIRTVTLCGRGVNAADFDDDGDLDVFVSNYRLKPDLLWVNTGNNSNGVPQFVNDARQRGVEGRRTIASPEDAFGHSIGAVWGDLDRDDDLDMVAARLAHSAWLCFSDITGVYESGGAAGSYLFGNRREEAGVAYNEVHSDASLADFDNDGHLDLHITHVYDGWRSSTYRNLGTVPFTFEDVTHLSGIWPRRGWGSGWADYDEDGDLDLAARALWRNRATDDNDNNWLQVAATGCGPSNRDAIGAKVRVTHDGVSQRRDVFGARGTGSQDSPVQHFGLGSSTEVERVEVVFPSGQTRTLEGVSANQRVFVVELGASLRTSPEPAFAARPVDLIADTCGETRKIGWDLDDDGAFDDGADTVIHTTFAEPGSYPVAVEVGDGVETVVMRSEVEVITYVPTPTMTPEPIPWPTEGPSPTPTPKPTIDPARLVHKIYLPSVARNHPPIPAAPVLREIEGPDGNGAYTVSWSKADLAVFYVLEEDRDTAFTDPVVIYQGGGDSTKVVPEDPGRYCYRVRGTNSWGDGPWSRARCFEREATLHEVLRR